MRFSKEDRKEYESYVKNEIAVSKEKSDLSVKEELIENHYVFNLQRDLNSL